jgi:hypothetical protein
MATKKKPAKRPATKKIEIMIDLGSVRATPEEIARLKAFVNNEVVTWAKYDTEAKTAAIVTSREGAIPPSGD